MDAELKRLWLPAVVGAALWLSVTTGSAQGPPSIETVAGNGGSGFSGDNGVATSASLK